MPIRPENRARYPADWPAISLRVRSDAGNRCEQCGAPNLTLIRRGKTSTGIPVWREARLSDYEASRCALTGASVPDSEPDLCSFRAPIRVVLTVAHLDHQPENFARSNLRALCQRCHLAYDRAEKARARRARRSLDDPGLFG